jgi:hypothetical protein
VGNGVARLMNLSIEGDAMELLLIVVDGRSEFWLVFKSPVWFGFFTRFGMDWD